jgi:hypothetical protein
MWMSCCLGGQLPRPTLKFGLAHVSRRSFFLIFFASSSCSLERRCSIMVKVSCLSCLESNDLQVPFSHVYIFSYSLCIMCARAYSVWLSLCWSLHTIVCPWSIEAYRKEYSLHVPFHMGIFMWNNIKIEVNWLLFFITI